MSEAPSDLVLEEITTTLLPSITKVDATLEVSAISVILTVSIIFILILSPVTVTGNSIILAAFYRYKRLRTASNCLLVSLAISDCGIGVLIPFGIYLELSGMPPGSGISTFCIAPYCFVIALCSVSVLVTVAIAVDRLTSLAQPLRYKNIITHSSIEKYIVAFWIYAIAVGFSPLIYAQFEDKTRFDPSCRFSTAIQPPVRILLVLAVWAPSALILLGCYMYVYWVARAHARAIYTVELSFRHQTQTLALPRYGQTLAITVGAFFILWLPFQACMLLDMLIETQVLAEWTIVWLNLPILAHSAINPWIYAFHHGEMRVAAGKIAEDLVGVFGITPSNYGCSPARRDSNTNVELDDVNSCEARRVAIPDCFAAKQHNCTGGKCVDLSGRHIEISPEANDVKSVSGNCCQIDIIEEDIRDLAKMLDPSYIIDRNRVIDSNHNIDKIKNLKYLLDPTFNKIRHLRRLNHKRFNNKNLASFYEPQSVSYQNLGSNMTLSSKKIHKTNTMSEPVLNCPTFVRPAASARCVNSSKYCKKKSNLSSVSDPNIKEATTQKLSPKNTQTLSTQSLDPINGGIDNINVMDRNLTQCKHADYQKKRLPLARSRIIVNKLGSKSPTLDLPPRDSSCLSLPNTSSRSNRSSPLLRPSSSRYTNASPNRLMDFYDEARDEPTQLPRIVRDSEFFVHKSSDITEPAQYKLLEPYRGCFLKKPTAQSEPSSPVGPISINSSKLDDLVEDLDSNSNPESLQAWNCSTKFSDPEHIPSVLLSIQDYSDLDTQVTRNSADCVDPNQLTEALLLERIREFRLPEPIFSEHNSTRYSSRRPSDSRWSESSRSQEMLPNVSEFPVFPQSYSVNNFKTCTSGSDITSCLDPFMCPDTLSSSLRESFFSNVSANDSDTLMSFEESAEEQDFNGQQDSHAPRSSTSNIHLGNLGIAHGEQQSRSSESGLNNRSSTTMTLEPSQHPSMRQMRLASRIILNDLSIKNDAKCAPLSLPTPTNIATPTFDMVTEVNSENGVGVRV